MALTKSQIVKQVNDLGFSNKQSAEIIETSSKSSKEAWKTEKTCLFPGLKIFV